MRVLGTRAMTTLIDHAIRLSEELGAPVFPVRVQPDPGLPGKTTKKPLVRNWQNGGAASTPDGIEALFAQHPQATHVGIQTGRLLLVDLDGENALQWWRDHADILPPTRTQKTQRENGRHLFYRLPSGIDLRNSASQIAPGVDIRASGGFACDWSLQYPPSDVEVVDATPELIELIRNAGKEQKTKPEPATENGIPPGQRNQYLSREAFRLRKQGSTVEQIHEVLTALNNARCNPPLSGEEITAIAAGKQAIEAEPVAVTFEDFYAYAPDNRYIFTATGQTWSASAVDDRLPPVKWGPEKAIPASKYIAKTRSVEQMTWAPGDPMLIKDRLIVDGGWIDRPGARVFNLYRPPECHGGDAADVQPWLDHLHRIYPESEQHIVGWLAHRVQRPGEKLNHALVLGGHQGIGKDTLLEPVKYAIGAWNFAEISPAAMVGRFNGFARSVILRVSEARDMGDVDRYSFYEHLKVYAAAPPDVLRVDEKNIREYVVPNVTGILITTNNKTNGIYLPADDRRHYVAWADATKEDFQASYWNALWSWYARGGIANVAAYLRAFDLSGFDAKAPPPKTSAWREIVDSNRVPEDAALADALDRLGNPRPPAVTVAMVASRADDDFREWLLDRRNSRSVPHRFEEAGYVAVRNEAARDGYFAISGKRVAVYCLRDLSIAERARAAARLATGGFQ